MCMCARVESYTGDGITGPMEMDVAGILCGDGNNGRRTPAGRGTNLVFL